MDGRGHSLVTLWSLTHSRSLVPQDATSHNCGTTAWDASFVLAKWLERNLFTSLVGKTVVELGSGCGVLSIVAARLGARCVHATDLEQALLLLARNVWLNEAAAGQAQGGDAGGGVTVGCCNWGNALHAERVRAQCPGERVDLILGSDLVYRQDRTTFVALLTTLAELSSPDTDILFASKFRMNPEDGVFVATATEMGFAVDIHALPARQNFVGSYQLFHLSKRLQQAKTSLIPSTVTLG